MIDHMLVWFGTMIHQNIWLAPVFAFAAGLLTAFTPCGLSSVPLVIAYVGGASPRSSKTSFNYSLVFSLGMSLTFVTLGVIASLVGDSVRAGGSWWYIALGFLMILMAFQTVGIITVIPQNRLKTIRNKRGIVGAFFAGILGGFFSSPCATPVLVALLALVAERGSLLNGVILLLLYSFGHSILVLVAGTSIGFVQKITASQKFSGYANALNVIFALVMLLLAFYMFYLGF